MLKRSLLLWVLLIASLPGFSFAQGLKVDQIAKNLLTGIEQTGKKRIAVVDFTDLNGGVSLLGKYLAEELSVDLTQSAKGIEVVDRAHLSAILQEHNMSEEGLTDPTTAKRLGELAGADVIVTGSITNVGDQVLIVAKALSTDSARIIAASEGSLPMTAEVSSLLTGATAPAKSAPGSPNAQATANAPSDSAPRVFYMSDLQISVQFCKRDGARIECYAQIEDTATSEREVRFDDGRSYMVDNLGTESRFDGDLKLHFVIGQDQDQGDCCLLKTFEPGISYASQFIGSGLSASATSVSIVLDTGHGKAILKNIPITQH